MQKLHLRHGYGMDEKKRNEMIYDWVLGKLVLYIYRPRKSKGFERERSKDNFGWREMRRVKVSLN